MDSILDDDLAFVLEAFKVGLKSQVVVDRLDVLGQDLAAFGDVDCSLVHFEFATAHSLVRAVPDRVVVAKAAGVFGTGRADKR